MGPHPTATDLKHWHMWNTPTYGTSGESWSAMPDGAKGAVVFAPDRKTLEGNIRWYMRRLDVHVAEARRKLDALPANYTGEREVQERLIGALARLAGSVREHQGEDRER